MRILRFRLFPFAVLPFIALLMAGPLCAPLRAQDTRTVTEPTFPVVCSQVQADLGIVGGEPSSELNTAADTSAIQAALTSAKASTAPGCGQGSAVELVANGGNNAFVIAPIYIPAGITLLVDGGVTVFGSRNAADYQIAGVGSVCGSSDSGTGCNPLITVGQSVVNGTSNTYYTSTLASTGIMGYGIINGRGQDKLITLNSQTNPTSYTTGSSSWWDFAVPGTEDVPVLVVVPKVANVILYKITLLNSPHFHVRISGQGNLSSSKYNTNFTAWNLKLITPWTPHNTDGIDPTGANNVSIMNSIIGDGDDEIAISGSSASSNFSFNNLLLPSGHGVSIGSITTNGVSNVALNNVNFSGQAADNNQVALRIKSYCGSGGAVTNVNYNGVCVKNVYTGLDLDPFYSSTSSTTSCPSFGTAAAPIAFNNIYLNTANARINFQGLNASTLTNMTLNNVYNNASTLNLHIQQSNDTTATPAYDNITLNGNYYPGAWAALNTAGGAVSVTETNNGTPAAAFPTAYCANAFPVLNGELYASTTSSGMTTNNINQPVSVTLPASVTLNAMVQPVNSTTTYGAYTGAPVPTASVQFLDGTTVVGTGSLGSNGTLASVTLTNPTAGTHVYTANYIGDTTYAATPFGTTTYTGTQNGAVPAPNPLVVTVNAGPGTQLVFSRPPASPIVYGDGPGTVAVAVEDVAGDATTSTAGVTLNVTGPNGYAQSYVATAVNGVATFSLTASLPGVGTYTYAATSAGLTATAASNETVNPATLSVIAHNASRAVGTPNPAFAYTITGFVNGDTSAALSGTPRITTTASARSGMGTYPITVGTGSLAASNYLFAGVGATLTVTGNPPQIILFAPLPNLKSGASYQLSACTTTGLPASYSVTGPATVNGATLTVTGPGTVSVTAMRAADATYSAAPAVTQTFTAQ